MFGKKKDAPVVENAPIAEEKKDIFVKAERTVIGPGITMVGDFSGTDPILIEGTVRGTVDSGNNLHVAKFGQFVGEGKAISVIIDGYVDGNVDCKELTSFTSTGKMKGNLSTARLKTEEGSMFEGTLNLTEKIVVSNAEPVADATELEDL